MNPAADSTTLVAINPVGPVGSEGNEKHVSDSPGIARSPSGRWKRKAVKTVRFDQSPATCSACSCLAKPGDGDIDLATAVLHEVAIENYTRYWNLPRHYKCQVAVGYWL